MVFLDANPVIDLIKQPAGLGPKATARVAVLLANGERLAVSDLVRMACQIGPLKANDATLLITYTTFFASPDLDVLPVSPAVCDRAARIRAQRGLKPLDSLHLAAAVEHGCMLFLAGDAQLKEVPRQPRGDALLSPGPGDIDVPVIERTAPGEICRSTSLTAPGVRRPTDRTGGGGPVAGRRAAHGLGRSDRRRREPVRTEPAVARQGNAPELAPGPFDRLPV